MHIINALPSGFDSNSILGKIKPLTSEVKSLCQYMLFYTTNRHLLSVWRLNLGLIIESLQCHRVGSGFWFSAVAQTQDGTPSPKTGHSPLCP